MLGFLFRGLTAQPQRGAALFAATTAEMRQPHWYIEGKVPDTIDGRFAVLATLTALAAVRIEQAGVEGNPVSVALTEQFIEVMESEHRELGIGDPTLGKKIRKLVGSLCRRVELWRRTTGGEGDWNESAHESLYNGGASAEAILHSTEALRRYWTRLERTELQALAEGRLR